MIPRLQFRQDGSFLIAQFTDLHFRNGEPEDLNTLRVMADILDQVSPDLVVLSGDVIDGSFCRDPILSIKAAVQPILDRNLAWAAVFGNHDDEGAASRGQLMAAMQQLPGCCSTMGPENVVKQLSGVGNFILPIYSNDRPTARLYFLDSHSYSEDNRKEYAWIKQDQIDWYSAQPHDLPALMFFHIPLPEYDDAWKTGLCEGSKYEPVCSPKFNSGLFQALVQGDDVQGVFVGHDHTNDFVGHLQGIQLCYGRATGFASYGKEGFPRGGRLIRLLAGQRHFQTWVECEPSES